MHRKEPFQHRERNGEKDAAVGGSCGEFFPRMNIPMMSRIMLAIKLKSPAEMSPVLAIRTARPVIPPKVKLFVNLKKYVPNAIRSVLNVSIKKCFNLFILFSPKYEIKNSTRIVIF